MDIIYVLGHKNPDVDSVVSGLLMEKLLKYKGYSAKFIIPDKYLDSETYHLLKKYNIDMFNYKHDLVDGATYFLVDHSKRLVNGDIIGIIDHHNNILKNTPDFYVNEDSSSAAMIIYKLAKKNFNKDDELLVVLANLVDTASFNSSKTKKEDIAKTLQLIYKNNFNYDELYRDGLCLTPLDNLRDAAFTGYKKNNFKNKIIASSYVQLYNYDFDQKRIMINIVKDELWKDRIDMYIFLLHDMKRLCTTTYFLTKYEIKKIKYNKYTSRKEAIAPVIERLYNE